VPAFIRARMLYEGKVKQVKFLKLQWIKLPVKIDI